MSRTLRAVIAVIFVGIIIFSAISICQSIGGRLRMDITEEKLYTLSDGTKAIVGKLNQPLKLKLYFTKTATWKASDQIRYYTNYYYFVKALLEEYVRASNGAITLEVIDPRPFSDEEEDALRYGLKRFPITQEENFFFGLVLQTGFGTIKSIPFFTPHRDSFVEYDISQLIGGAMTREKKQIGILSSLPVMGEDVSGFMAQMMRAQGRNPGPPWQIIEHLKQKYTVTEIKKDAEEIKDVDVLLVIHPKELSDKTLFAIDQFVLKGGPTIVCVDPHCFQDQPDPFANQAERFVKSRGSDLNKLLRAWGLEMVENYTFAGDRSLAVMAHLKENRRPEKLIGYLNLTGECFNSENVITSELNQVKFLFAGVLRKVADSAEEGEVENQFIPLLRTTGRGNSWKADGAYELVALEPERMMEKFEDGFEPVTMSYLVTGRFKSAFPEGLELEDEEESDDEDKDKDKDKDKPTERLKGLTEASADCAVAVFSDVDFITDMIAYSRSFFGIAVALDNNSDLLLNTIDDLSGSSELIGLRSRGNYRRPFVVVEDIRKKAEEDTAEEEAKIKEEIAGFQKELNKIVASAKDGEEKLIEASILDKKKDLNLEIRRAQRQLRQIQMARVVKIDALHKKLQNFNMLLAPAFILAIAIILGVRKRVLRKRYVSHASDA